MESNYALSHVEKFGGGASRFAPETRTNNGWMDLDACLGLHLAISALVLERQYCIVSMSR